MTAQLVVLLAGRPVGTLIQDHRTRFVYAPEYLQPPVATPLSLSMPRRSSPWSQAQVIPWLAGLLPDSADVRQRWAQKFGVSARNPFALVGQVGHDLPGAVQIVAAAEQADAVCDRGELRPVTARQIGERLARLRTDVDDWAVDGERWSLGGAQSKFALAEHNGHWYEALGAAPTTRIIKPGITGFAAQGMNEHVTMTAARALGIRAARTRYLEFDGQPAIVVDRYDRAIQAGRTIRIHQEDFCQATATPPNKKYETDGRPGAARISDLLRLRADPDSNWRFVEAIAFNYLIGASDAHAKNYSVLLSGNQVRLAPLYDMASSLPCDPVEDNSDLHKTAMAIGGERRYGQVTRQNWGRLARRTVVDLGRLLDRVVELVQQLPDAVSTAISALPPSAERAFLQQRYLDRLPQHLDSIVSQLNAPPAGKGPRSDPAEPLEQETDNESGPVRVRSHLRNGRPVAEFRRSLPTRRLPD